MKLDTHVLCTTDDDDLGIKGEDVWLPCRIDLSHLDVVKKNGKGENSEKAVLYFSGSNDPYVIHITYEEFLTIWK